MKNTIIDDAIANMDTTSKALEKFCDDPKNYNSPGAEILYNLRWELLKRSCELRELQYTHRF